ncbi:MULTISPECIES: hypothetical protein [Haloferacaceae]|uniref:Uncharacterized protein n=1 Tax=Halorubrum glutamatedens TaxID=2707018 RepID=A0ABD5QU90_9EURY|nr:hypothetical protein [Halobellus captivus]
MSSSDGEKSPEELLGARHVNYAGERRDPHYGGTDAAFRALEEYLAERLDERTIATARTIAFTVDADASSTEIGKTLGAHQTGDTSEDILEDVVVSTWGSTNNRTKWVFERVEPAEERP